MIIERIMLPLANSFYEYILPGTSSPFSCSSWRLVNSAHSVWPNQLRCEVSQINKNRGELAFMKDPVRVWESTPPAPGLQIIIRGIKEPTSIPTNGSELEFVQNLVGELWFDGDLVQDRIAAAKTLLVPVQG